MATQRHPVYGSDAGYSLQECGAGGLRVVSAVVDYTTNHAAASIIRMCKLPAGHRVADVTLIADAIDDVADMVIDVGIQDTIQTDSDTTDPDCFFDGSTLCQAGGVERTSLKAAFDLAAVDYDRWVTVTIMTDAATLTTGGDLGVILTTRPVQTSDVAVADAAYV